jgi:dihydrofolate reductase
MLISCIVAVAQNGVIGAENQIPWYLPADLAYFKRITLGHTLIMGRNCFESIGRPLPKRTNIVITRNPFFVASGVIVVHSVEEALAFAKKQGETEAFIIGGGEIYLQTEPIWDKLYLTEVDIAPEGNVFFGLQAPENWALHSAETHIADEKNTMNYTYKIFEKKGYFQNNLPKSI